MSGTDGRVTGESPLDVVVDPVSAPPGHPDLALGPDPRRRTLYVRASEGEHG